MVFAVRLILGLLVVVLLLNIASSIYEMYNRDKKSSEEEE